MQNPKFPGGGGGGLGGSDIVRTLRHFFLDGFPNSVKLLNQTGLGRADLSSPAFFIACGVLYFLEMLITRAGSMSLMDLLFNKHVGSKTILKMVSSRAIPFIIVLMSSVDASSSMLKMKNSSQFDIFQLHPPH